ncbi:MAG: hypothetical protein ABI806_25800, partial [Candidatus Solibacter sp.]
MSLRILSAVFGTVLVLTSRGLASPIFVANASFENPVCGPTAPITCPANNWALWAPTGASMGAFLPLANAWNSIPDGLQVGFSNGGALTQSLGVTIVADMYYTLSVWVSQRWSAGTFMPDIELLGGSTPVLT